MKTKIIITLFVSLIAQTLILWLLPDPILKAGAALVLTVVFGLIALYAISTLIKAAEEIKPLTPKVATGLIGVSSVKKWNGPISSVYGKNQDECGGDYLLQICDFQIECNPDMCMIVIPWGLEIPSFGSQVTGNFANVFRVDDTEIPVYVLTIVSAEELKLQERIQKGIPEGVETKKVVKAP